MEVKYLNKQILLTILVVLTVALSVGSIYASDVNVTDVYTTDLDNDTSITTSEDQSGLSVYESVVDNDSSFDVLKSEDSSTLSNNIDESNIISSKYNTTSAAIDVSKTITSKDITKYYKGSTKYTANFLNLNSTVLANTKVKITVNGYTYTKTTDSDGVASLDINLKPGTYKVTAQNPVTGYNLTNTFKILTTITASDVSKVYTDGKKFYAKFLKSNGKALANKKVKFKINKKTYTIKTNSKGVAGLSLKNLNKGTYQIISYNKDGLTKINKVKVVGSSTTSLTASDYTFIKSDTKKIKARLLNKFGYAPGSGKIIKFKVNGKTYSKKTNSNGYATLKLPSIKAGTYTIKYSFSKSGVYKASCIKGKLYVIPSKNPTFTVKSTKTFGHGAGTKFKVALTSGSVPIVGKSVTLTINGNSYEKTTNKNGVVSQVIDLDLGNYTVSYSVKADSKINFKSGSTHIKVVERTSSSLEWKGSTSFNQGTHSTQLLLLDVNKNPISGGTVKLTVKSNTYTATTDSKGYVTLTANYSPGNYTVSYEFVGGNLNLPTSGNVKLTVLKVTSISIKNIIAGANTIKSYYASNSKIPSTVTAGGLTFTMPEFLYLMSQAIYQISKSKTSDITIINGVSTPSSPSGDNINADLMKTNYITVVKNTANFISKNHLAPNYASSVLGNIAYDKLIDAESRILSFYGNKDNNNRLPNYVTLSTSSGSSSGQSGSGLNEKCTVKDLSAYLKATTNCQVNNNAITKIVKSVTSGLTSTEAKAKAIFNYVRDKISYSFYYDTKHGAVGTLNAKSGNCVDQAHLIVAMCRNAGIAARYVHGTCKFSSGSTYGHVWAQVLVDGKWIVADPTSTRNSFGNIVNWNANSFRLNSIYTSLPF